MTRLVSTLVLSVVAVFGGLGLLERQLGVSPTELWRAFAEVRTVEPEHAPRIPATPPPPVRAAPRDAALEPAAATPAPVKPAPAKPKPRPPVVEAPAVAETVVEEPAPVVVIEPDRPFAEEEAEVADDEADVWVESTLVAGAGENPNQDAWAHLIRRMLALYRHTAEPE